MYFSCYSQKVDLTLYGSFAKTYKGHGTDRALIGGLLGYKEDDANIRVAHELAKKKGMEFSFIESPLDVGHPNVVRFDMYDEHNRHMTVIGRSLGGGQIMITEVDGMICPLQEMSLRSLCSMRIDLVRFLL